MSSWSDRRILELFGIDLPIVQAPMAGATTPEMVIAVSEAGGLGSLPCALSTIDQATQAIATIRAKTSRPINLNFFCHSLPEPDPARMTAWREKLSPFYLELGLDPQAPFTASNRAPFDEAFCGLVEAQKPEVVSFHFGLPPEPLLARVKAAGAKVIASATTVAEARWLEARGCNAIIAMGFEAGGHRGNFLTHDMASQVGTMALVPQVVDAVKVPVIAAGGITDARGIVAAFALGASAVQLGTAYLFCPEAQVKPFHREALDHVHDDETAITNVFTGRPARGIVNRVMREVGPLSALAPSFPLAGGPLASLVAKAPADFANMWSGQAASLGRKMPAGELTRKLAQEALEGFAALARP
ncbi:NAD(P)H-dependent flavin oxidoreductase [Labilithrix luteola]|nr:nitronate monooxygenase family protein [Labilithrix luteola]